MHDTTIAINVGMAIAGTSWIYDGPTENSETNIYNENLISSFKFYK